MDRLDDIEAFLAVVEKGSLTAAARHLHRSLQSISRSLTTLERSVAVDLVRRTTRQSHPTEAGLAFYRRVRPAFTEIRDARLEAASQQAELTGLLRVGAPALFAAAHIVPVISELVQRHPQIEIELKVSDREVDARLDAKGQAPRRDSRRGVRCAVLLRKTRPAQASRRVGAA
jgi:DNA-binding transcriptional LysR family regulator